MTWAVTADPERFDEASDWFGKRIVMTRAEAHRLDDATKADAFWVGAGLQLSQVQSVFDKIERALARGDSFEDFRKAVRSELGNRAHTETVFRNATQRAYNAGRWFQMQDPEVRRFRPYGLVDAIIDGRETAYCRSVNNTILPLDDPWFTTHWFPAHHNCRTSVRNITRAEAERRGVKLPPPGQDPAEGFGQAPTRATQWKPDPAKHDPALIRSTDAKSVDGVKYRKPRRKKEHSAKHWRKGYEATYGVAAPSLAQGKASYERGLDMRVGLVRDLIKPIDAPGVRLMLESLEDADPTRSLRSQAGETDPLRKAAAALAGHMEKVGQRAAWSHADLAGTMEKRATEFVRQTTDKRLDLPDAAWAFRRTRGRSSESLAAKLIEYSTEPGALEHEIGHSIEDLNATLFRRALVFLRARTVGDKLVNHGTNGDAWHDNFVHYYTGRNYTTKAGVVYGTEVMSTALEVMFAGVTHWGTLEQLAQKDLEHLLFLLGQLSGE